MYTYKVKVKRIYDADTIFVDIDLGMKIWKLNEPIRLDGINAPEMRGPEKSEGIKSRDAVREWLKDAKSVVIVSRKLGKFGRPICMLYYAKEKLPIDKTVLQGKCLNDQLLEAGLAKRVFYD